MRTQRILRLLICSTTLLSIECRKVKPEPPKAEGFDAPIAPVMSYVAGPIRFPLRALEEKISQELSPQLLGKESSLGRFSPLPQLRVVRSGPVHLQYSKQQVQISAPIEMWLRSPFGLAGLDAKEPFCVLNVNFASPLAVSSDWRLLTQAKFDDYTWISRPKIRLIGKNIYLTSLINKALEGLTPTIENAINSAVRENLKLDEMVAPIWRDLQKPLLLSEGFGIWLLPQPVSVVAGPVFGDSSSLSIPLRIALQTRTEIKPQAPAPADTKLPMLQKQAQVSPISELHVLSFVPFTDINRMLKLTLTKQPMELARGALTLKIASVYSGQRMLIVKADVSGLVDGTVYLRGRPVFDSQTSSLRVDELSFDDQTQGTIPLTNNALVQRVLSAALQRLLVFSLGEEIHQLPNLITKAYQESKAGEKTDLKINSFQFVPRRIAILANGIQTLVDVKSTVKMDIRQL